MKTKLRILNVLFDYGECTVADVADISGVPPGRVFAALQEAARGGHVVRVRRDGLMHYAISNAGRTAVFSWRLGDRTEETDHA
ncbi:MarR family transcriptional regulator [Streptomyces albus]|uniref:MarR family transcriptional regulator n=1 Tax=Streptomyces albus TaxID=1888 RepID=UPI0036F95108